MKVQGEYNSKRGHVRERAIEAFKRAHPSCPHGIRAFKNRGLQIIKVYGYEDPQCQHGARVVWSYADNGKLKRVRG